MPAFLYTATLPHLDGFARDDVKVSIAANADDTAARDAFCLKFRDFWQNAQANTHKVSEYIASTRSRASGACFIQIFDITGHLDGSPHGSPVGLMNFTLAAAASPDNLPAEVAARVSLRAFDYAVVPEEGGTQPIPTPAAAVRMGAPATHTGRVRPRSRKRGGFYIGPLNKAAIANTGTDNKGMLDPTFQQTLGQAAAVLMAAGTGYHPGVWSRRNAEIADVIQVLVDNAPDTQRRRGERYTVRTAY